MKPRRVAAAPLESRADWRDDFETRLLVGDLPGLMAEIELDPAMPPELAQGIGSLHYFREFYRERHNDMGPDAVAKLAAYDAAWCQELIDLALTARADYRDLK